ncbi:MAG: pyrroline-5-carboxylate reductase [Pseudomonadota bacterium]
MNQAVLLVGCGNMGFAMLKGWIAARPDLAFHVIEPTETLRERAGGAGATVWETPDALPSDFDPALIVLAVKPQVMDKVAPAYGRFAGGSTTFVSVAAGVTMATLGSYLPGPTPIIRTMPNTPAAIGLGMMVSVANHLVDAETRALTDSLMATSGASAWIDTEDLMDAVTAISGSGPAYVFHFIECLAAAGERLGLPSNLSMQLARQTVMGAGHLASESDTPPNVLREQVTSPAGTTAAALAVLMQGADMETLMQRATMAARDRGRELGRT